MAWLRQQVNRSATSVIDNSTHFTVPSNVYVSLPAVVGNDTIPLKGDEKSAASTTAEMAGTVLTTSASSTASAAAITTSTSAATPKLQQPPLRFPPPLLP